MIFDTHAHYDDKSYDLDLFEVIQEMINGNVTQVVNIGASMQSSKNSIALAKKYPLFYATIGVHPDEISGLCEEDMNWLREHAKDDRVVAIGEIGLDYYWNKDNKEEQKKWFKSQIQIARENNLPLVIHSRDAAADTLEILKEENAQEIGGIIHCYSYSVELMKEYVKMGFYIGIGGVLTFKNAKVIKEVVAEIPMNRLVLETDAPYLSPDPFRGKRNISTNLYYVACKVAEIKGISLEEVYQETFENGYHAYRISR